MLLYALRSDDSRAEQSALGAVSAQCGACTVLLNGVPVRSCATPVDTVGDRKVVTPVPVSALPKNRTRQAAFIEEQVPHSSHASTAGS